MPLRSAAATGASRSSACGEPLQIVGDLRRYVERPVVAEASPTPCAGRSAIADARPLAVRRFDSVFDPRLQLRDHAREVRYAMTPPPAPDDAANVKGIYIHGPTGCRSRRIDDAKEKVVDQTRMGAE